MAPSTPVTHATGRLAPASLEGSSLAAHATPIGPQAGAAGSSLLAQLAPAKELSSLDRSNWNALAIDGTSSWESGGAQGASAGYNLSSLSPAQSLARSMRPADASLARHMEEACAGDLAAECEDFDRLVLQNNLISVVLPGISSSKIAMSCGGGGYTCCSFAETMLNSNADKSLRAFGERHPQTWQRLLGKAAGTSVAMVSWDKAISTLFLNSSSVLDPSTSERRGRLVAEALGTHVFWTSAPISMLNDPCNHIMPTPYEIVNEGLVEMRSNTVWGLGSRGTSLRLGDLPSVWEERVPKVFYRGKRKYNSAQRGPLYAMGDDPANQAWLDAKDGDHQGPETFGKHRYALDIGGLSGTTWNALRNKMRMGSLVLRVDSGMADWWHGALVAGEHYLPVKADLSDLKAQFDWAEAHPADAERMAEAGRAVEAETSTLEAYDAHYERVLGALAAPGACGRRSPGGLNRRLPDAGDGWLLEDSASGGVRQCSAGHHTALEHECMAAAEEAAQRGGVEVIGKFLRVVDAGEDTAVPPGCSWSNWSKRVLFNTNPRGAEVPLTGRRACGLPDGAPCYRLACTADRQAAGGERRDRDRQQEQDVEEPVPAAREADRETPTPAAPRNRMPPKPASASTDDCAPRIMQVHHKSGTQMVGAAVAAINYVIRHRLNSSCLVHVDENCFFADCPLPPDARVVHIVRNTYDMVVSGYLYHRGGGEGWDAAWLGRSMVVPEAPRTTLDAPSQATMCVELVQGSSNVIQRGVCWNLDHGAKEVFSQGVADVVDAARDERFGDDLPPPLDAHESYTAFLQRVPPRAGLLSEVIASRASRSTMIGLHTRYRTSVGTFNFGFEDFQTASIEDCTARWRDVVAAFDYPLNVREDMATRAAQASCMAASDVQHNAQGHTTSDDQGGLVDELKRIDEELLGGQVAAEMAELSDSYVNAQRDLEVLLQEKSPLGVRAYLGMLLRDCHAQPCMDAHWESKTGQRCSNLAAADHDDFGNLARDVCCQYCGQSAP